MYPISTGLSGVLILWGVLILLQPVGYDCMKQSFPSNWLCISPLRAVQAAGALGFVMMGMATALLNLAKTPPTPLAIQLLTLAILSTGSLCVLTHLLWTEDTYPGYAAIALYTGTGLVIHGIGLFAIELRDGRYAYRGDHDDSRRIYLIGGLTLAATALIGGFGGFSILHPQTVHELHNRLQLSLKNRNEKLLEIIDRGWQDSFNFANQPLPQDAVHALLDTPFDPTWRSRLQRAAEASPEFGFSALAFISLAGSSLAEDGSFAQSPELDVPLNAPASSRLLWTKHGFVLHTRVPVRRQDAVLGFMEAERPLPQMDEALHDTTHLGETADFAICAAAGENMHCFPFRSTQGNVLRNYPRNIAGQPLPMSHALAGKSGVVHARDYRGRDVIAAYRPMGDTGLGTVLKIDSAELYQPVAATLWKLPAILLPLMTMGFLLLRLQVMPLVRKMAEEIGERKKAEKYIRFLAYHDALTGLPNRLQIQERFDQAADCAQRNGSRLALVFLDLDGFKRINDSLGHSAGDAVLKEAAARLRDSVRNGDTVSRQGGDEFLILLTDLGDDAVITKIMDQILTRQMAPFHCDGFDLSTSVSMGIAVYPDDGRDFETLLKKADMAMYQAKDSGRNTYRFHNPQMSLDAIEHLQIYHGLRRAIDRDEFVLYYQPQIDLASGRITGAEALLRWQEPERGLVTPGRFIAIAEESGLITPIGEWVLEEACRQAAAWRQMGVSNLVVAVNISAVQFLRGNLDDSVVRALERSGLAADLLELELTESALIHNTENTLGVVRRLKSLGVRLSIDDFGTGYSNLAYLRRFAVDKIKIDQSFVRDMLDDPNDAAIIRAIIQMARTLNLKTTAEGVEHERTLDALRRCQCDEVQGYHISEPLPTDRFTRFLLTWRENWIHTAEGGKRAKC